MSGIIATGIVAHVPTLSRAEITPDFQTTLVDGERRLGEKLRALKPDLWVVVSTHWVSTFNWFATLQPEHKGICVADEAPDLIPGLPYRYPGDPAFAEALLDEVEKDASFYRSSGGGITLSGGECFLQPEFSFVKTLRLEQPHRQLARPFRIRAEFGILQTEIK